MDSIFINISFILAIAIGIAFLVRALRQPLLISYILTGIVCGPIFLNLINSEQDFFHIFANFGVILLLFLVGLSLNINYLRRIGKVALVAGVGQVIFTSLVGFFIFWGLGFSTWSSVFLAISVTFSSTIIITKLLSDKKEIRSVYGRYTIGLMLVQDIIAILIMIFLPVFGLGESLLVSIGLLFLKSIIFLVGVYLLTRVILPILLDKVAESGEFLLIFTLGWCFAIAGAGEWAGLSLEVGAIIAGLALAASEYQTEIVSRIKPLRDFFIALFFIILGSEMSLGNIQATWLPSLLISLFILIGNPLILYALYRVMKFTRRNSFLAGLTAAQVSEFGFVFLFVSAELGFIGSKEISVFTLVALITIFISSYLITYNSQIFKRLEFIFNFWGKDKRKSVNESEENYQILVFGYHRLGWKICEGLREMDVSFAVIDCDPEAICKLRYRKIPHYFGDASDVEFLSEISLDKVDLVISTLPELDDQVTLVKELKKINPQAFFVGNLSHTKFLDDLYDAGADLVIVPHLLGGQWLTEVLKKQKWNKTNFRKLRNEQKKEMTLRYTLGH